jgi:MFS transporter, MHS family, citrate/tricarballylate:H+ symporter
MIQQGGKQDSELAPAARRRAIAGATIGNGLEFYDFITYAFFAIQIGNTFFPSANPFLSLMASLATFGAGFVTRPLGAYVLGGYADRRGRKPAMLISMVLMGIGILLLVVTPGYREIGLAAPIIAVAARLIQGFALGGEIGSATSYLIESATIHRRGFTVSWQGASQSIAATIGALVGLGLSLILTEAQLADYGWRIALALGTAIIPFALWIRHSLPETLHAGRQEDNVADGAGIASYARVVALGAVLIGAGTTATYIFQYMATFGQNTLKLSPAVSLGASFGINLISVLGILAGGWLSDRYGRKRVMLVPQLLFILAIMPCFLWLTEARTAVSFIGATMILAALNTPQFGAVYAAINESLPRSVRARAFALVYSIPVAALGGTTQLVITWLLEVTGEPVALGWYLTLVAVIALVAMLLMRESAPHLRARDPALLQPGGMTG